MRKRWPRLPAAPLLVRDDAWAPGLVGLVAGRLAESLARPIGAATLVGDEVRGSIRAPSDFHVAAALEACAALLTKRGGHAAAGGFSLLPASWAAFHAAFAALPRPFPTEARTEPERPGRQLVDLVVTARHLDWTLSDDLTRLAPYGPGHLEPVIARYRGFGWALGIAFQLNDDLLGIWGAEQTTGKAPSDVAHKKKTLPVIYAVEHAGPEDRERLLELYAIDTPSADDHAEIVAILERVGARQYTRDEARRYRDVALAELDAAGVVRPAARARLEEIIVGVISA